jgi:hypothetical protein
MMAAAELKISKDQKKLILAIGLGIAAILALWWTFFGFGGRTQSKPGNVAAVPVASPRSARTQPQSQATEDASVLTPDQLTEINFQFTTPLVPDARRNVFAYYLPPAPKTPTTPTTPEPTPPPPPLLLAAISPASVYARTAEFTLDATGDKFTPEVQIVIDGREFPTRYKSPQQLSTNVPAAIIANAGPRQIIIKTSDGKLYSNTLALNVTAPPTPNYTYVGHILKTRRIGDIAILQDKGTKEILNVQRGDLLGGRFRVTSISERELMLLDTNLAIKHTLPLAKEAEAGFPQGRPTPRVVKEDDEP